MFYGWWIVVGSFFLNFAGIGIIMNSMGVFIKPVSESLGFTRGGFTLYFTVAALAMMVMAPVMGKLLERYNIRLIMTVCTTMMATSFALFSQCRTLPQFYILALFLGIGSAGLHIIPVSMMITNWFIDKRGLAMGVVFAATGVGRADLQPSDKLDHHQLQLADHLPGMWYCHRHPLHPDRALHRERQAGR